MSRASRAQANAAPTWAETQERAAADQSDRSDLWLILWIGGPAAVVVGLVIAYAEPITTWARAL